MTVAVVALAAAALLDELLLLLDEVPLDAPLLDVVELVVCGAVVEASADAAAVGIVLVEEVTCMMASRDRAGLERYRLSLSRG